jgi:hypothetical protein
MAPPRGSRPGRAAQSAARRHSDVHGAAGSRDLWASDGESLPGFLPISGLDEVQARLGRFDEADLQRQVWIIRNSIEAVVLRSPAIVPPPSPKRP